MQYKYTCLALGLLGDGPRRLPTDGERQAQGVLGRQVGHVEHRFAIRRLGAVIDVVQQAVQEDTAVASVVRGKV